MCVRSLSRDDVIIAGCTADEACPPVIGRVVGRLVNAAVPRTARSRGLKLFYTENWNNAMPNHDFRFKLDSATTPYDLLQILCPLTHVTVVFLRLYIEFVNAN